MSVDLFGLGMPPVPFCSPAVLTVWLLAFVCAMGWVPAVVKQKLK